MQSESELVNDASSAAQLEQILACTAAHVCYSNKHRDMKVFTYREERDNIRRRSLEADLIFSSSPLSSSLSIFNFSMQLLRIFFFRTLSKSHDAYARFCNIGYTFCYYGYGGSSHMYNCEIHLTRTRHQQRGP
ncbi:uncharacterized protein LOC143573684 [Bidens hawaiensis]|uniref:uncharacterized protein LOC143573684 n=1 Tax=Bidens hawaiensis TaxID=980011 RepID=UPI00404B48F0